MDLLEAIEKRQSRRAYLPVPIDNQAVIKLRELIDKCNRIEGVAMRLVLDDGAAFQGFRRSYGMLSGVLHSIVLIDRVVGLEQVSSLPAVENTEKMGYYGEWLVLHAVTLGLGSCWVGGSFSKEHCPVDLHDDEKVVCAITIGQVADEMNRKEKLIRNLTHRRTKTIEEMIDADAPLPLWFMNGMRAVQKAPSAVNRQPVIFSYHQEVVRAHVKSPSDSSTALDLGIAKLHFELGAGGGSWEFGNGAAFTYGDSEQETGCCGSHPSSW